MKGISLGLIRASFYSVYRGLTDWSVISWSHLPLPSLDYNTIVGQMRELEDAFEEVVGVIPRYMRPPFLAVDGKVLSAMANLGYHVIGASIDTKDYENNNPELISRTFEKFRAELNAGGTIILSHDVHEQTVYSLTRMMLEEIFARGLQRMSPSYFPRGYTNWIQPLLWVTVSVIRRRTGIAEVVLSSCLYSAGQMHIC